MKKEYLTFEEFVNETQTYFVSRNEVEQYYPVMSPTQVNIIKDHINTQFIHSNELHFGISRIILDEIYLSIINEKGKVEIIRIKEKKT
jgi:hypothetical protein